MIKVVVTLAKNALELLITVASASATDDAIKKNMWMRNCKSRKRKSDFERRYGW